MTHLGAAPLDSWLLSFKRNPRQERAFKSQRETDPRAATLRPSGGSHYAPPEPRGWSPLPLPSGSERRGKGVCVGGGAGGGVVAFKPREPRTQKLEGWKGGEGE